MSTEESKGIFLNGKQQIIEMLQFMSGSEKEKLLQNIGQKNAVMARELREKSFSFQNLDGLGEQMLRAVFERVNPAIIGLALYQAPVKFQRRVLASINRATAEAAFEILNQDLTSKTLECKRAQEKIVKVAIQVSRAQMINL
ncbi:MAG: FliG C-terminal domain-containing protein [Bdellovibrionota bacterium]|nr:FliG C-terminal domain-containing protein [Bdellovibrionota bacterium]